MPARSFPLQPRWGALVGALLLFGGGALFLAWRSATNDRELIVNGIFHFSIAGAKKFYAVMAVLSLAITGMAILATIRVMGGSQVVIVEDDAVTIPGALLNKAHRIPYRDIRKLEIQTISGQRLLRVTHAAGSSAVVEGQVGGGAFAEIVELVQGRVRFAQTKR